MLLFNSATAPPEVAFQLLFTIASGRLFIPSPRMTAPITNKTFFAWPLHLQAQDDSEYNSSHTVTATRTNYSVNFISLPSARIVVEFLKLAITWWTSTRRMIYYFSLNLALRKSLEHTSETSVFKTIMKQFYKTDRLALLKCKCHVSGAKVFS